MLFWYQFCYCETPCCECVCVIQLSVTAVFDIANKSSVGYTVRKAHTNTEMWWQSKIHRHLDKSFVRILTLITNRWTFLESESTADVRW